MHTRVHTHQTNEKNNIKEPAERRLPAEPQTCRSWTIDHKLVADVVPSSAESCPQMSFSRGRSSPPFSPASRAGIIQNQTVAKQNWSLKHANWLSGLGIQT